MRQRFVASVGKSAQRAGWSGIAFLGLCWAASACQEKPTEVVVSVYTDVGCEAQAAVAVGPVGELGDRPASAVSTVCDPETGSLGTVVLVPRSENDAELSVEVRVKADRSSPDDCLASSGYQGCIVARRILNYLPERSVKMRIDLRNPCVNTPCSETTSCVAQGLTKACVDARIDLEECDGECDDGDLVEQNQDSFDPCAPDSNPCGAAASCVTDGEATSCVCDTGYRNDSEDPNECVDVDECEEGTASCDEHARCTNRAGGFDCECLPAYSGDGQSCEQVECERACGEHAACLEQSGGFECRCDDGYEGDGIDCTDIDECATGADDCAAVATCQNTAGGYECECPPGQPGDGTTCQPLPDDECTEDPECGDNAQCVLSPNGNTCECLTGYVLDASELCVDEDECQSGNNDCAPTAICTNTSPGYECECPLGSEGDGTTCVQYCSEVDVNYAASANGASAAAQTTFPGYSPANAIDGDTSTVQSEAVSWVNDSGTGLPQWFDITFAAAKQVTHAEVYSSDGYVIRGYDLQYWDGSAWQTLVSVTDNSANHLVHDFPRVLTDRIRVLCTQGSALQSTYARLNEVEVSCR